MTQFSKEHQTYLKLRKRKRITVTCLRWGVLAVLIALWELMTALEWIDPFIVSSPSRIFRTLGNLMQGGKLFYHIGITLGETVLSFLLATVLGTAIAIALWWFPTVRSVIEPHLVVLNALPKIALGPIIIIWVGAGAGAIITMALLISLIITVISTLSGLCSVEKSKLLLMQTLGASKWQTLTKLILPANIPTVIDALKINVGLCWVGTIMGEYLISRAGLGYLIIYGGQIFQLDLVMTSTVVLCALAGAMYFVVELFQKFVNRRMNFVR